jgi:phosphatidylserine/phosphatidylglycerophosphate/cardiolipin synthase-like enzyme
VETRLRVYTNDDDALLVWTVDDLDVRCSGFAINREHTVTGRAANTRWLDNFSPPGTDNHQIARHQPSDEWPFRSFSWTDHEVERGDEVSYRVVPVLEGEHEPNESMASAWSDSRTVGTPPGATCAAHFNRGFVISQFMSRYFDEHYPRLDRDAALKQFKADISTNLEDDIRGFLSGSLREALLDLLKEVRDGSDHVYAALFELGDEELIDALTALGTRAHVVLANGSVEHKKGKRMADERETEDENADARDTLGKAHVEVFDRRISPGALGHNKFLVVGDATGETGTRVWTGSTNWTTTGLCTQLNNALLVEDGAVAKKYLEQWHALVKAKSDHPPELAEANAQVDDVTGKVRGSVHFTRAAKEADLHVLRDVVRSAKQGILFLMFIPGDAGALGDIRELMDEKPQLHVRGVVSELPRGRTDEKEGPTTEVKVTLVGAPKAAVPKLTHTFEVIQPEGNAHPAAFWAVETTHQQFKQDIGFAIIHSKVLVVDPFTDDPTVVTGSHNFSLSASRGNDENFIVVRGDRALAESYAVNVQGAWRHYAGRGRPHSKLTGNAYLASLLKTQRAQESFWAL